MCGGHVSRVLVAGHPAASPLNIKPFKHSWAQLSGPRPLRCCTPAQPANISLTQHQAGGQDGEIQDGNDEDVTTPQNYYGFLVSLYWYWPHPHLVPALVAGDHSQVPIKHISASPRTQSGSAGYSCTQNDGRLTGSLLTNFLVYSPV